MLRMRRLISSDQRPSALSVAHAAGARFFLYKPIDKDRLLKLVRATQGVMEQERRRTRRVPIQSKVRLKFGEEEFEGETLDVSMSSLLVRASRTAPVGSSLQMSLRFCYENKRKSFVFIAALLQDGPIFMLRGARKEPYSPAQRAYLRELPYEFLPTQLRNCPIATSIAGDVASWS